MIHPYDDFYLSILQNKLAELVELALVYEKIDVDDFQNLFINY